MNKLNFDENEVMSFKHKLAGEWLFHFTKDGNISFCYAGINNEPYNKCVFFTMYKDETGIYFRRMINGRQYQLFRKRVAKNKKTKSSNMYIYFWERFKSVDAAVKKFNSYGYKHTKSLWSSKNTCGHGRGTDFINK